MIYTVNPIDTIINSCSVRRHIFISSSKYIYLISRPENLVLTCLDAYNLANDCYHTVACLAERLKVIGLLSPFELGVGL